MTRGVTKLFAVLVLAALLATGIAACGGDSTDSTSTTTPSSQETAPTTPTEKGGATKGEPEQGGDKGGSKSNQDDSADDSGAASSDEASAPFRTRGGDNSIQNFGEEADSSEVDAATTVLRAYLVARSKDEWQRECGYLAQAAIAPLEELAARSPQLKGEGCAAILTALMGSVPTSTRANPMTGDIVSLRIEDGDHGFALFHGANGVDYFVSMAKEGDQWKVAALAPNEFP